LEPLWLGPPSVVSLRPFHWQGPQKGKKKLLALNIEGPGSDKAIEGVEAGAIKFDENIITPDTPAVEDPVFGRFYIGHGYLGIRPMLWFLMCPCLQGLRWRNMSLQGRSLRVPMLDCSGMWMGFKCFVSLSAALCGTQIVLLVLGMLVMIVPLHINNMVGPSARTLVELGAKETTRIVKEGEWWRLITSLFLSAGAVELAVSAALHLRLGVFLEFRWGTPLWGLTYFVTGSFGMAVSAIVRPRAVTVGGLTAIAGLLGAWTIQQVGNLNKAIAPDTVKQGQAEFWMLLIDVALVVGFSFASFNDITAMLAALLAGTIIGVASFIGDEKLQRKRIKATRICATLVMIGLYAYVIFHLYNLVPLSESSAGDNDGGGEKLKMVQRINLVDL
jgi:rhomboid protease GluP